MVEESRGMLEMQGGVYVCRTSPRAQFVLDRPKRCLSYACTHTPRASLTLPVVPSG